VKQEASNDDEIDWTAVGRGRHSATKAETWSYKKNWQVQKLMFDA
jgi:hypothetical protein